ncbi:ACGX-repeat peptide [uncultured Oscillibacter sp.]|uniref:ACGX-repeat peptide n=1 Tax=uncultured Oscillibacter sp. TaxID=876091 RepID=UPI0025D7BF06|nr:ACGX-repeat peptide [uncultured Oscillibacter sp.]
MGLEKLFDWTAKQADQAAGSACASACGAGDPKPAEPPTACGSACGAGDQT